MRPSPRKQPNFMIVGAPKCGTTSLVQWLRGHSQVYIPSVKEPHYFSTDLSNRVITSRRQYDTLFDGAPPGAQALGEASTWYLFSRKAVANIESEFPNMRYLVMTRDPVEMAQSLHHHNLRVLHEDQGLFEDAWRLQERRARGLSIPPTCTEPAFLQYQAACSLGTQLESMLDHVSPERILHIPMDLLKMDPAVVYEGVQVFLDLSVERRSDFTVANPARGYKSYLFQRFIRAGARMRRRLGVVQGVGLARINERAVPKKPVEESFLRELEQIFESERRCLADLAGRVRTPVKLLDGAT